MNNQALFDLFKSAHKNLSKVAPNHIPWAGHLQNDPDTKSRFTGCTGFGLATLADFIGTAELANVSIGNGGALLYTFKCSVTVGDTVTRAIVNDRVYDVVEKHGCLQAAGAADNPTVHADTDCVTVCLTPEAMPDGVTDYVLASVYPGAPDPVSDWSGLKAGDKVTGAELIRRGVVRCC